MGATLFSFGRTENKLAFIIVVAVLVTILTTLSLLNATNYPTQKAWYRTFNKVVYLWGGRLLIAGLILDTFRTVEDYNPLESTSPSLGETATRVGVNIAGAAVTTRNIRSAKQVEAYYKTRQQTSSPTFNIPQQ